MSTHKMVIVVRKDLNMRKGKLASQASHAGQEAILVRDENNVPSLKASPDVLAWLADEYKKVVVSVNSEAELLSLMEQAREQGLNYHLVQDLGHTEFHGQKTYTALALGPAPTPAVDALSGHLPLL